MLVGWQSCGNTGFADYKDGGWFGLFYDCSEELLKNLTGLACNGN